MKLRYEQFGAILALEHPPLLAYVDRDFVRHIGLPEHPLWERPEGPLCAPTEAHLILSRKCSRGCAHCYVDSQRSPDGEDFLPGEVGIAGWKKIIDQLASMGVFHVAMGGGESLELKALFEIARYARKRGLVPNLTTEGSSLTPMLARACKIFGQVNVSLDSVSDKGHGRRGRLETSINALKLLKKHRVRCGINMVVSRQTYDEIPGVIRLASRLRLHDVELLRFKPGGRGANYYESHRLTDEQSVNFFPLLKRLRKRSRISIKVDCSFLPHLVCHAPDRNVMEFFGVLGCEGGNHLIGVTPEGLVSPCSFYPVNDWHADELRSRWEMDPVFQDFRHWDESPPEPCASCDYRTICKGGCHAVALHLTGSMHEPDPECPLVVKARYKT